MSLEMLQNAWAMPDRRTRLNTVVEQLARQGSTRPELDDALGRLLDEVRARDEGEEAEELIAQVGDRLHGWCQTGLAIPVTSTAVVRDDSERVR